MGKFRQSLFKILTVFLIWTLIALAFAVLSYLGAINEGRKYPFGQYAFSNLIRYYLWAAFSILIYHLTKKFNFEIRKYYIRNFLLHFVFAFFFSSAHFISNTMLTWLYLAEFREHYPSPWTYIQSSFLGSLYLGYIFYALIVIAVQAYLSRLHQIEQEKKASQLQSELVQAQLQALKMQLQPHFLFNTLNSISSLVLTNPPQAHTMIAQLGDFLRLTLDYNEDQMVLLKEEIRFLSSYLEIEQTRFSDRLKVSFDVEKEALSAVVPHLVLQPIVENSIKHGIAQINEGGNIEIKADKIEDKLRLKVTNDGPKMDSSNSNLSESKKGGTGLANVQTRLKHIYGQDFSFQMKNGDGTTVTIILPFSSDFTSPKSA